MDELQKKHRLEQKDLGSRIMQKKKSATKKTRKGINDECAVLERELKEKQLLELAETTGVRSLNPLESESLGESNDVTPEKVLTEMEQSAKQLSISDGSISPEQPKKPNRQKARLARRTAEQEAATAQAAKEAEALPNLRDQEREAMQREINLRRLTEKEIRSDGHCLYAAIADQLAECEIGFKPRIEVGETNSEKQTSDTPYKITRRVAASFILHNPNDFLPFVERPMQEYTDSIRNTGEWGGHLELVALAKAYGVTINVLQADGKIEKIQGITEGNTDGSGEELWLSYYRHSFGLGEHYNSLRRIA